MRQGMGNISHASEFFRITCTAINGNCVAPLAPLKPGCNLAKHQNVVCSC